MSSPLSPLHRLDVAATPYHRGCIKLALETQFYVPGNVWTFGLTDYESQNGFEYHVDSSDGVIHLSESGGSFLELSLRFPQILTFRLAVHWFGSNFLPTLQVSGLSTIIHLPAKTLGSMSHVSAVARVPRDSGSIRFKSWMLEVEEEPKEFRSDPRVARRRG